MIGSAESDSALLFNLMNFRVSFGLELRLQDMRADYNNCMTNWVAPRFPQVYPKAKLLFL